MWSGLYPNGNIGPSGATLCGLPRTRALSRLGVSESLVRIICRRALSLLSVWGRLVRHETGRWRLPVVHPGSGECSELTRLIVRSRGPEAQTPLGRLFWLMVFEPAHFIMERENTILRIKQLAEVKSSKWRFHCIL